MLKSRRAIGRLRIASPFPRRPSNRRPVDGQRRPGCGMLNPIGSRPRAVARSRVSKPLRRPSRTVCPRCRSDSVRFSVCAASPMYFRALLSCRMRYERSSINRLYGFHVLVSSVA